MLTHVRAHLSSFSMLLVLSGVGLEEADSTPTQFRYKTLLASLSLSVQWAHVVALKKP